MWELAGNAYQYTQLTHAYNLAGQFSYGLNIQYILKRDAKISSKPKLDCVVATVVTSSSISLLRTRDASANDRCISDAALLMRVKKQSAHRIVPSTIVCIYASDDMYGGPCCCLLRVAHTVCDQNNTHVFLFFYQFPQMQRLHSIIVQVN